jgi:hypothetical protein
MTIDQAKRLQIGDTVVHNGVWAYRNGSPSTFTVLTTDDICIRVSNERGSISRYDWSGCTTFVTRDFFASCTLATIKPLVSQKGAA